MLKKLLMLLTLLYAAVSFSLGGAQRSMISRTESMRLPSRARRLSWYVISVRAIARMPHSGAEKVMNRASLCCAAIPCQRVALRSMLPGLELRMPRGIRMT